MQDELPETISTYLRLRGLQAPAGYRRKRRQRKGDEANLPFMQGRDPMGLGDALAKLTGTAGWDAQLAQEELLLRWREIVGAETAQHAEAVGLVDGTLTIQCDSTAWAKQLQLMRVQIITQIAQQYPAAKVQSIRFLGPDVPSWKRGPRTAPGRGPRDTYG